MRIYQNSGAKAAWILSQKSPAKRANEFPMLCYSIYVICNWSYFYVWAETLLGHGHRSTGVSSICSLRANGFSLNCAARFLHVGSRNLPQPKSHSNWLTDAKSRSMHYIEFTNIRYVLSFSRDTIRSCHLEKLDKRENALHISHSFHV